MASHGMEKQQKVKGILHTLFSETYIYSPRKRAKYSSWFVLLPEISLCLLCALETYRVEDKDTIQCFLRGKISVLKWNF